MKNPDAGGRAGREEDSVIFLAATNRGLWPQLSYRYNTGLLSAAIGLDLSPHEKHWNSSTRPTLPPAVCPLFHRGEGDRRWS